MVLNKYIVHKKVYTITSLSDCNFSMTIVIRITSKCIDIQALVERIAMRCLRLSSGPVHQAPAVNPAEGRHCTRRMAAHIRCTQALGSALGL